VQGQGLQVLQHLHQTFLEYVTEWPTPSTHTGAGTGASGSPAPAPDILRMCDRMATTEHLFWYRDTGLKVHKIENFFGFDFEFCTISMLVMHK
jgi:hypothetical protein